MTDADHRMDASVLDVLEQPRLAEAELRELAEIERLCFPPRTRYSRALLRDFLRAPGGLLVRARQGEQLAGFQLSNWDAGHLITLDVRPEFREQGIGSMLLRRTLEEFRRRGTSVAQCEIAVANWASIQLHLKFHFLPLGIIPQYYEDGGDALFMRLKLSENEHTG